MIMIVFVASSYLVKPTPPISQPELISMSKTLVKLTDQAFQANDHANTLLYIRTFKAIESSITDKEAIKDINGYFTEAANKPAIKDRQIITSVLLPPAITPPGWRHKDTKDLLLFMDKGLTMDNIWKRSIEKDLIKSVEKELKLEGAKDINLLEQETEKRKQEK